MPTLNDMKAAVDWLRTPEAIRERCGMVFAAAERGELEHFALDLDRLNDAARYVIEVIRKDYPNLDIPYHSRWRHFAVGADRWAILARYLTEHSPEEVARIRFELAITSVLLDAGAGSDWRFVEPQTGIEIGRSEGLALASFNMFVSGAFADNNDGLRRLRADASVLSGMGEHELATHFQVAPDNPLVGVAGRAALLQRLGAAIAAAPEIFGTAGRLGGLFDHLAAHAKSGRLPASAILSAVLRGLGPIWPGRLQLDGENLGDVWRHSAIRTGDVTDGLVPFHKLSQWLTYSLVEPLEEAGVEVTDLDALTGLPEYRNGGLFLDCFVLRPKHAAVTGQVHSADSELVVEWRALTVILLDRLAARIRTELGLDARALPLAKVLQGGTWSAGRYAAETLRDGAPPIRVASDGTVF